MMLTLRASIANRADGRYECRGWLHDEPDPFAAPTPKRRRLVRCGDWRPPHNSFASVRTALRSITTYAHHMQARVRRVSLATYGYDQAGKRVSATWSVLR